LRGEEGRKTQASDTRAPTGPENIDTTSSPSIVISGSQHSKKNDTFKEVKTSNDIEAIQSNKPDLGFHPGMMGRGMSGLNDNASKEKKHIPRAPLLPGLTRSAKNFARRPPPLKSGAAALASHAARNHQGRPPTPNRPPPRSTSGGHVHHHRGHLGGRFGRATQLGFPRDAPLKRCGGRACIFGSSGEMEVSPARAHILSPSFLIDFAKPRFSLTHTTTSCSKIKNLCRL
jgi:hypothetical protein